MGLGEWEVEPLEYGCTGLTPSGTPLGLLFGRGDAKILFVGRRAGKVGQPQALGKVAFLLFSVLLIHAVMIELHFP